MLLIFHHYIHSNLGFPSEFGIDCFHMVYASDISWETISSQAIFFHQNSCKISFGFSMDGLLYPRDQKLNNK